MQKIAVRWDNVEMEHVGLSLKSQGIQGNSDFVELLLMSVSAIIFPLPIVLSTFQILKLWAIPLRRVFSHEEMELIVRAGSDK